MESEDELPDLATLLCQLRVQTNATTAPQSPQTVSGRHSTFEETSASDEDDAARRARSPTHISDSEPETYRSTLPRRTRAVAASSDEEEGESASTSATSSIVNGTDGKLPPLLPCYTPPTSTFTSRASSTPQRRPRLATQSTVDPNEGVLAFEPTPKRQQLRILHHKSRTPRTDIIDLTESDDGDDSEGSVTVPASSTPLRSVLSPATPSTPTPRTASKNSGLSAAERDRLPFELCRQLSDQVFGKAWDGLRLLSPAQTASGLPPGLTITWNARLSKTAGQARWKKVTQADGTIKHQTSIELSTKVIDSEDKLKHTLAHELCHLAVWTISGQGKENHGPTFKLWASRVMQVRPDIAITTTHKYEIVYKHRWQCDAPGCGRIFGRHSASIDPARHACGCGGALVAIDRDGLAKTPAKKTAYQSFLAVNPRVESPKVRRDHPGISFADVNKIVASRWKEQKGLAQQAKSEQTIELALSALAL